MTSSTAVDCLQHFFTHSCTRFLPDFHRGPLTMRHRGLCSLLLLVLLSPALSADRNPTCRTSAHLKIDESFLSISEATGGMMFNLRGDELGKLSVLSSEMFLGRDRRDPLSGIESGPAYLMKLRRRFGPSSKDEYIDVDSTVTKLFIFLNAMRPVGMELSTPDGSLVTGSMPGVKVEQYSSGCLVMIENVRPGTWRVRVEGSSAVVVHVEGRTPISFFSFDYVRWAGRPGHQGWFDLKDRPRVGEQHRAEATIFGPEAYDRLEEFQIRSLEGDIVTSIPVEQEKAEDYLVGPLDVPREMSRIYATGRDKNGYPFQRMYSHTIEGQPPLEPGAGALGVPLLITAAIGNDLNTVRTLLQKGEDVNARSKVGNTALMSAAQHADVTMLKLLLERGADVNAVTKYQGTALFRATVAGNVEAVRLLVGYGARADVRDGSGYTALEWATKKQYHEIIALFAVPGRRPRPEDVQNLGEQQ